MYLGAVAVFAFRYAVAGSEMNAAHYFLIKEGFIRRTPRGREVTLLAYNHLNKRPAGKSGSLFD